MKGSRSKAKKGKKDEELRIVCAVCRGEDGDESWVGCDKCEKWFHINCQKNSINKEVFDLLNKLDEVNLSSVWN